MAGRKKHSAEDVVRKLRGADELAAAGKTNEGIAAELPDLLAWYNDDDHHGWLGLHTPAGMHYGTAETVRDKRAAVLIVAYRTHPERFVRKRPEPPHLPTGSWINPPEPPKEATQ